MNGMYHTKSKTPKQGFRLTKFYGLHVPGGQGSCETFEIGYTLVESERDGFAAVGAEKQVFTVGF